MADLPSTVAIALDICLTDGPTLDARADALLSAGWRPVSGDDIPTAATAFAAFHPLRIALVSEGQTEAERRDILANGAAVMQMEVERQTAVSRFFLSDRNEALRLNSRFADSVTCLLAAAAKPDDIETHFGLTSETTSGPIAISTRFSVPGTVDTLFTLDRFAPGLFGATNPLPLIATPPAAITE
jgi:hypothetical protein